jgi:hypothetical protein
MRGNGKGNAVALLSAGAGLFAALTVGALPASATTAKGTAGGGSQPVIVFLKNQWAGSGSRIRPSVIRAAQAPYLKQLGELGATGMHGYVLANAIAARIPAAALPALTAIPGVASVMPDSPVKGPSPAQPAAGAVAVSATYPGTGTRSTPVRTPAGACSAVPQLEPEGLAITRTASAVPGTRTARSLGYTGAGVKVAFLADGIDTDNPNLMRGSKRVISDYKDFSGDGTAAATAGGTAFTDASALAGQGSRVLNVANFGAQTPASPCLIRIEGTAPGSSLVALKVFGKANLATTSGLLAAIDYAVTVRHVNVLNESFGTNPFPDVASLDAVEQFNDAAVRAGTTVVVASGSEGPANTIGSPAADPAVISVGASTGFRFYAQTNLAAADQFAPGGWTNNDISAVSSGGYTQDNRTLSLVAPGDDSFASCTPTARYSSCVNFLGKPSSLAEGAGTSQAASLVAGAAALVLQAYAKQHGGSRPTPAAVKRILLSTATDLGAPAIEQGAGMLDTLKAVELAGCAPSPPPPPTGATTAGAATARATTARATAARSRATVTGPTLLLSANQLNFTARPGALASWPVTVTNTGPTTQHVAISGREFSGRTLIKKATVTLADRSGGHFTNWSGIAANYATVRFTVPRHEALLDVSIAWRAAASQTANPAARVRFILVGPARRLAADSMPQGNGGYGAAQVLHPAAGTWTAVIFSDAAAAGGTAGAVRFGASVAATRPFGTVSRSSLVLLPGASRVIRVTATVPAGAGDSSGAVVFATGHAGGGPVSIPVTLRGMIVTKPGRTANFNGVLTGGNGTSPGTGQVAAYSISVPSNLPAAPRDIDADVVLANDPANQVSGYLIAPGGETMGYGTNYLTTGFTAAGVPVESPRRQLSVYASDPVPGVWTLVLDFTAPVPGNELSDPFTGQIRLNAVRFSRGGLPGTPAVTLHRGKAVTYQIAVHNTGLAPENIFLDPRLGTLRSYRLQPQDRVAHLQLPLPASGSPPEWIVPTMTHAVSVTAASPVPVTFDFGPFPGDPDQAAARGTRVTATYPLGQALTPVTQGLWYAAPAEAGPFTGAGALTSTVSSSMNAVTQQFDTTASPSTGDFWRYAVSPIAATASYNLFVINPGQTRTISLTVKPTAAPGTVVRGRLYIDDFADSLQFLSGSQLAALPYAYTVGK